MRKRTKNKIKKILQKCNFILLVINFQLYSIIVFDYIINNCITTIK